MRLVRQRSSNDYVVFVRRGCRAVMPWSRCGWARIGVQRAEGPWEDVRKYINVILLGLIDRARGERMREQGFMLARNTWGQLRRDAVLPVRSSGCRRTGCGRLWGCTHIHSVREDVAILGHFCLMNARMRSQSSGLTIYSSSAMVARVGLMVVARRARGNG